MIPERIVRYLQQNNIEFTRIWHPRAVTAQEVAAQIHETGYHVAKTVVLDADGQLVLAVLPAAEMADLLAISSALDAHHVDLADEAIFEQMFPDCEQGAEPPFGGLFGMPVLLDQCLADASTLVLRAGSHEETIQLSAADFVRLERPRIAQIGRPIAWMTPRQAAQPQPTA